jgi:pre-mycofactocin synthase
MASTKEWFESVAEAQRRAKKRLPKSVYYALFAGAEQGVTLDDNVNAFSELGFLPHIAADVPPGRDQTTTVLGRQLSLPVIISPTGVQAVSPRAELAVAGAAAQAGTAIGLGSFGSKPIEQVIEINPETFFQIYWLGSQDRILQIIERASKAGAKALIVTIDWTFAHRRDWGSPAIPERLDLQAMMKFAPQALARPGWLWDFVRHGGPPDLTAPNLTPPGGEAPTFFQAYGEWIQTPLPSWSDIGWLRKQWDGPFVVKGVMRPDDARRAVDIGADAVSVSNHGGNNLDGTPASIRALPGVVDAVGDEIEILFDGGIRRGSDVVKALALGARAVMIGRAYLWGLAANGQAGVHNILEILRSGIDESLIGLGHSSIHDLSPDDISMAPDFTRGHSLRAAPRSGADAPSGPEAAAHVHLPGAAP